MRTLSLAPASVGAFFLPNPALSYRMDESLERIIRRALDEARAKGRDYISQTEIAVQAGRQVRPDLTASEVLAMVRLLQQS